MEKQKAKVKYEDAVASGQMAVIAESNRKQEEIIVKVGNLQAGQEATLKLQVVNSLQVYGGYFQLTSPIVPNPEFKKNGVE